MLFYSFPSRYLAYLLLLGLDFLNTTSLECLLYIHNKLGLIRWSYSTRLRVFLKIARFKLMPFEGGTPLNKPPIDLHTIWTKNKLLFLPHVTLFWKFPFDILEASFLNFDKKYIFSYIFRFIFPLRVGEQRHSYVYNEKTASYHFRPRMNSSSPFPYGIKNHCFLLCWALTSYTSLNFIILNNHAW